MNMDAIVAPGAAKTAPVYVIQAPAEQTIPFVYCSPHSGTDYAETFRRASKLDLTTLRKSEDSHVDALFGAAPDKGAPLLSALFPRAYVDPNREPYELDQAMFEERLPDFVNTASPRVAAGLGTIAKVVCNGAEIYRKKLRFAEALERIGCEVVPLDTGLLRDARRRGHPVVDGLGMLIRQAVPGFRHWGGIEPTVDDATAAVLLEALARR